MNYFSRIDNLKTNENFETSVRYHSLNQQELRRLFLYFYAMYMQAIIN